MIGKKFDWTNNIIIKKVILENKQEITKDEFIAAVLYYLVNDAHCAGESENNCNYYDLVNVLEKCSKKYNEEIKTFNKEKVNIFNTLQKSAIPDASAKTLDLLRNKLVSSANQADEEISVQAAQEYITANPNAFVPTEEKPVPEDLFTKADFVEENLVETPEEPEDFAENYGGEVDQVADTEEDTGAEQHINFEE